MQLHYSRLSEKDRRQYAALESLKLGWGGITYINKILGIDRKTIPQGRKELTTELEVFIPRTLNANQAEVEKKTEEIPEIKELLTALIESPKAGSPTDNDTY